MERNASPLRYLAVAALVGAVAGGCSSKDKGSQAANAQVLDPTQPHYGHTYTEWSVAWWQWIYGLPQTSATSCVIPFEDPTGANCAYHQPGGDVFFLAGTQGGTVVRNQCKVPSGQALFFPIISSTNDNAGQPPNMQSTNAQLKASVQTAVDMIPVSSLAVEFDGVAVTDLARFKTQVTQYSYTVPPEPNVYTCGGAPGVTGVVNPSYEGGYFIMLSPPSAGAHTLHFKGTSPNGTMAEMIDVTYNFTVAQ